ncbi:MAG: ankyrin repeat domain-containing protein [Pseudomonadota bacterium]
MPRVLMRVLGVALGLAMQLAHAQIASLPDQLTAAIYRTDIEAVRTLLAQGVPVNAADNDGFTPLVAAASAARVQPQSFEIIDLLLAAGANLERSAPVTALDAAARNGQANVMAHLLGKGAKINAGMESGHTALFQATWRRSASTAAMLIAHGANVHTRTAEGWTPLHMAALYGMAPTVRLLIKAGASVNARAKDGKTPLAYARRGAPALGASKAKPDLIKALVKAGAVE